MSIRSRPVETSLGEAVTRRITDEARRREVHQVILERKTGITQSTISRAFNGLRVLSIDEADALCDALGLSLVTVLREAKSGR